METRVRFLRAYMSEFQEQTIRKMRQQLNEHKFQRVRKFHTYGRVVLFSWEEGGEGRASLFGTTRIWFDSAVPIMPWARARKKTSRKAGASCYVRTTATFRRILLKVDNPGQSTEKKIITRINIEPLARVVPDLLWCGLQSPSLCVSVTSPILMARYTRCLIVECELSFDREGVL